MTNFVRTDDGKSSLIIAKSEDAAAPVVAEIPYGDIRRVKIRATQWRRYLIVERKNGKPLSLPVPDDAEDVAEALDKTLRQKDEAYRLYNERQDKKHELVVSLCVVVAVLFAPVSVAVLLLLPAVVAWSVFAVMSVVLIGLFVSTALT